MMGGWGRREGELPSPGWKVGQGAAGSYSGFRNTAA